ncbi:MAG TPA: hypothetical protein VMW16_00045 [Sedimentisphaerales bacterium]|nr:hypothetical protein [Sedimentisphaerales bacterium]
MAKTIEERLVEKLADRDIEISQLKQQLAFKEEVLTDCRLMYENCDELREQAEQQLAAAKATLDNLAAQLMEIYDKEYDEEQFRGAILGLHEIADRKGGG